MCRRKLSNFETLCQVLIYLIKYKCKDTLLLQFTIGLLKVYFLFCEGICRVHFSLKQQHCSGNNTSASYERSVFDRNRMYTVDGTIRK